MLRMALLKQPVQNRERNRALFQSPLLELTERKRASAALLFVFANLEPAFPAREVGRQLAGGKLRALELGGRKGNAKRYGVLSFLIL
jgi:hypothetical protein